MSTTRYEDWFRLGSSLWKKTYRVEPGDDAHAYHATIKLIGEAVEHGIISREEVTETLRDHKNGRPDIDILRAEILHSYLAAARWIDGGSRTIMASTPEYFAAMAQTRVAADAAQELHVPWPAFVMKLPPGLIVDSQGHEYSVVMWSQFEHIPSSNGEMTEATHEEVSTFYQIASDDNTVIHAFWPGKNMLDVMIDEPENENHVEHSARQEEDSSDQRIRDLVRRASIGLLYTLEHTDHWRHGGHFDRAGFGAKLRSMPPPHRTIIIGRPIDVDVREAVAQDARSGTRSAPSVQTLVRGHLKRQVFGQGRTGRKVIWIEPYWRGPEDAPILARPYKIGPS